MLNKKCPPEKFRKARELRKNLTRAEARLWKYLRCRKLDGHKFRRKAVILGYIVDFYCPKKKLIIEVEENIIIDAERQKKREAWNMMEEIIMRKYGFMVLRITGVRILDNLECVLNEISDYLV